MTDLTDLSVADALAKLRAKEVSAVELTQAHLDRIDALEPTIHAFITRTPERHLPTPG